MRALSSRGRLWAPGPASERPEIGAIFTRSRNRSAVLKLPDQPAPGIMSPGPAMARGKLNPEQQAAVERIHGPVLILAGAGSGKTTVITHRIQRMVARGAPSSAIVGVTFTNKSAREMKLRLQQMLPRDKMRGMVLSTFHSLGNRILQKEIEVLPGFRTPFSILSPDDLTNVLADIYRQLKMGPDQVKEHGIANWISLCKNSNLRAEEFAESRGAPLDPDLFADVYSRYATTLRGLNAVDFDDLILLPQHIFKAHPEILKKYRGRWRYFLVDEFQDTNPAQYELLLQLVGAEKNLCVVGDDDQSIYGWRGAEVNIILGFERDFPGTHVVRLETNYRSTGRILAAANAVIRNNAQRTGKTLRSVAGPGEMLKGVLGRDEVREAELVCEEIRRMTLKGGRDPGHFAILFRTNFQSRAFEQELRNRNIPHHVVGGYKFFDRREVRDMIAYLRAIANPRDETALTRVINRPRRGIGEGSIAKIGLYIINDSSEDKLDFWTVLERVVSTPGLIDGLRQDTVAAIYEFMEFLQKYRTKFGQAKKLAPVLAELIRELNFEAEFRREGDNDSAVRARTLNLSELVNMLGFMEDNWEESEPPTIFDFLARISMMANDQEDESPRGRVQLLTLHLSKGLEFPVVFLTGLEEGLFPGARSLEEARDKEAALAEERRLFYVGLTRAKEELYLTLAGSRRKFGEAQITQPSRFLDELPPDSIDWITREEDGAEPQNALTDFLDGLKSLS